MNYKKFKILKSLLWLFVFFSFWCNADAKSSYDQINGPINARLIKVIDGDTILVNAHIWLSQEVETLVRIRGVDAPELKGKCYREKNMAEDAKKYMEKITKGKIELSNISEDKYGGRILADVYANGINISKLMLEANLARPYNGQRRDSWC